MTADTDTSIPCASLPPKTQSRESSLSLAQTETASLSDSSSYGIDGVAAINSDVEKRPGDIRKIFDSLSPEEVEQAAMHSYQYFLSRDETKRESFALAQARRHYLAEKYDVNLAIKKMKNTLKWREEFGINAMRKISDTTTEDPQVRSLRSCLESDMATGKVYVRGYDRENRALYVVTPSLKNSEEELPIVRSHIYALERCIACTERMSGGEQERIVCIFDFNHFGRRHSYPLKVIGKVFGVLNSHYPERINKILFLDAPVVFRGIWNLIKPFVDPVTGSKIRFVQGKRSKDKYFQDKIDPEQALKVIRSDGQLSPQFDVNIFLNGPFDQPY